MTPEQFQTAAQRIYGKSGWKGQLADALDIHRATIGRYAKGARPIPETVALALEGLMARELSA
jgi:hypothetical protein